MATLESEIADKLKQALTDNELTVVEGAKQLGVSRQSLHAYIAGTACPSVDILYRACALWGVVVSYGGLRFGIRGTQQRNTKGATTGQLKLPFTLEDLRSRDIEVKVGKKTPRSAKVQLSITITGSRR